MNGSDPLYTALDGILKDALTGTTKIVTDDMVRDALQRVRKANTDKDDALREMIDAARVVNKAAGQTVFNPTALSMAVSALGEK